MMVVLYIDPGTGSMLFSIVIGLVAMLYFLFKALLIKLKFVFTGGKGSISKDRYPLVIYSEGKKYWNIFMPVLDSLEQKEFGTVFYTSSKDDPVFNQDYKYINSEFIGEGNKAFMKLNFLEADVCLMTTPALDVYQLKRSKGVKHYSHILHAVTDATTYRLFGLDYFDSVLLTGEFQKRDLRLLEQQRNTKEKELVVVGSTYLDVLKDNVASIVKEEASFTVLVAPSWGEGGILRRYGSKLLDKLIETNFHIIVRPHPQSKDSEKDILTKLKKRYEGRANFEWDYETENLKSLSRANIMISDFSGVIFDYSFLFDKPFLYVNNDFDHRPYDSYDLPELPWIFRVLPEIGVELKEKDFDKIKEILTNISDSSTLKDNRQKAKETAWQHIGESGIRTAEFLIDKVKGIQE
ncbi:MAG: CDP-glycerol glycerophosphotransferase family protein [Bacilli bacterium]|nr:CDP-glycerol glycerophosphotransferase family protein [Bacilli bacterium]